jgi:HSP20 family protein
MVDERDRNLPEPWDPSRPWDIFERLRRGMESMMDELDMFGRRGWGLKPRRAERSLEPMTAWELDMDLRDFGDHYELSVDMPDVDKENVDITLHEDQLMIQGERRTETREEREGFLRSKRYFGSFSRQVPLPPDVDPDQISATMNNGVLTLNMPKSEERRGRQIDIR